MASNRSAIAVIENEYPTLSNWKKLSLEAKDHLKNNVALEIGWGKLVFAHTFRDQQRIVEVLLDEQEDERNIAFYVPDPHVILSQAPQDLFLDPSHTFRCWFDDFRLLPVSHSGFIVRTLKYQHDLPAINCILKQLGMVLLKESIVWKQRNSPMITLLVAEEIGTGKIIGSVMGVDHRIAFNDSENGASLWALAVDSFNAHPGIGEALVLSLISHYKACGRAYLDLSVMHDNKPAIALYEKLGFDRIPVFTLKKKNTINEPLYTTDFSQSNLNPYAMIIIKEAKKRGIQVEVVDEEFSLFNLSFGGVQISCRESLTDLTSAVTMSICDNKRLTWKILKKGGLKLPDQVLASTETKNARFLEDHKPIVVKPASGEQGKGVIVDINSQEEMEQAIIKAGLYCEQVILEEMVQGNDLRIVVIDYQIIAAAIRQPPVIVGDGIRTVRELIQKLSARRSAQTGGESTIPLDSETERCIRDNGYEFNTVLPEQLNLQVRKTANLHTGGKLIDVTEKLHPVVAEAAVKAAKLLKIPVVGLDFIVSDSLDGNYRIIEANERPGLANHEPQPTAECFVDLLFPNSASLNRSF